MASSAELGDRTFVLTGASGGIGRAIARSLAEAGARLVLVARRAGPLEEVARQVGGRSIVADTADAAAVRRLMDELDGEQRPFGLVNAAGTFDLAPVGDTDIEMFDRMIDGNLRGPFLMIRALLPAMLEAAEGHIVTIGSVAGRVPLPGNGAYSASKYGVRGLHEVLEQELRGTGVRCTLVDPAATDTGIWDPLDPDSRDDLPSRSAMMPPGAVADAVRYALTRPRGIDIPALSVQGS